MLWTQRVHRITYPRHISHYNIDLGQQIDTSVPALIIMIVGCFIYSISILIISSGIRKWLHVKKITIRETKQICNSVGWR